MYALWGNVEVILDDLRATWVNIEAILSLAHLGMVGQSWAQVWLGIVGPIRAHLGLVGLSFAHLSLVGNGWA